MTRRRRRCGDPRAIHRLITLDHLLRMRSGLAFPVSHGDGRITVGFENSAVYQDAGDAFEAAQRSIVATVPGAVYRYINSGLNVLGAIVRDQIERRGLPYCETLYGLLADRLGMASYQHSADIAGNLIASGAGFATLRDYRSSVCCTCRTVCGTASGSCHRAGPTTR
jgi:CubicO group peptidase (beta-lactamase class C family)